MLYACVRGVMDVVLSVCIVTQGAVGACVWEVRSVSSCGCCMFVCILWQFSVLHDLQFIHAGRGCKRQIYGRGILQSWSHDCFMGSH